jgi:hypothetical protein
MATQTIARPGKEDRRRLRASLLVLALSATTMATLVTGAIFTDTVSVGSNAFSTGTVDLTTSPASGIVSFTSPEMAPGDSVVGGVTVTNAGTLEYRYAVRSTTTENTLAGQLDLTIWDEAAESDAGTTCAGTAPATVLYGPADLGSTTGVNVVGNPNQGSQAGDRALSAGTNEVLCFKVLLPTATGNSFQNLDSTATFEFSAEQTANN